MKRLSVKPHHQPESQPATSSFPSSPLRSLRSSKKKSSTVSLNYSSGNSSIKHIIGSNNKMISTGQHERGLGLGLGNSSILDSNTSLQRQKVVMKLCYGVVMVSLCIMFYGVYQMSSGKLISSFISTSISIFSSLNR